MSLEAFKTRVLPTKDKLFRFALRILKSEEDAQDIVQEAMIRVWNKRDEIHTYNNMEAWCMRVVRNLSLDKLKSKHSRTNTLPVGLEINDTAQSPYSKTETDDTMMAIHKFIDDLPQKQRYIIQLRDIEGYSYKEIAEIINEDINNVKVNLFRARKAVRENLLIINNYGLKTS